MYFFERQNVRECVSQEPSQSGVELYSISYTFLVVLYSISYTFLVVLYSISYTFVVVLYNLSYNIWYAVYVAHFGVVFFSTCCTISIIVVKYMFHPPV